MKKIIVTIVTVLAVAVFSGTALARTMPIEPTYLGQPVELVWGDGSAPHFAPVRTTRITQPQRVGGVELRWGYGGPPVYVPITGGRTVPAVNRS